MEYGYEIVSSNTNHDYPHIQNSHLFSVVHYICKYVVRIQYSSVGGLERVYRDPEGLRLQRTKIRTLQHCTSLQRSVCIPASARILHIDWWIFHQRCQKIKRSVIWLSRRATESHNAVTMLGAVTRRDRRPEAILHVSRITTISRPVHWIGSRIHWQRQYGVSEGWQHKSIDEHKLSYTHSYRLINHAVFFIDQLLGRRQLLHVWITQRMILQGGHSPTTIDRIKVYGRWCNMLCCANIITGAQADWLIANRRTTVRLACRLMTTGMQRTTNSCYNDLSLF